MKVFIFCFLFSFQALAVQTLICTPARNSDIQVEIQFPREIDPQHPFVGFLEFSAALQIKGYKNLVRVTPEVYTTDISLRGDSEAARLRLYPQFNQANKFTHYTGQLFVNDLDTKTYFNFKNQDEKPGLVCQSVETVL